MTAESAERFAGLTELASRLAAKEVTSAELTEAALERAETSQKIIGAFRVIRSEKARDDARAADARLANGERGPLLGVPVAIKDDSDLAGETTPFGCAGDFEVKATDGEAIRRLRQAGAVVIGKTHTPELGLYPWTEGPAFGVTRNPWSLDHTPGGSSGGSAAAVAAGVIPVALGSDGAGSVRIPASWTNLVGIKPQRGRISTWPDPEAFYGITCIGPLARTVSDAALLLDAVTGNHPGDRHQPPAPAAPFAEAAATSPPRLRIALALEAPWVLAEVEAEPEVQAAVRAIAEVLSGLGHIVEEAVPAYRRMGVAFAARASAGVAEWCGRIPDLSVIDPRTASSARVGRFLTGPGLGLARAAEGPIARRVGRIFERFDVVVTPVTASPPLVIGAADGLSGWKTDKLMSAACPYAWPWNYLGWPAMSVPAGFVGTGLPVGAQLVGPPNREGLLISLAAELEAATGWSERHPSGFD